MPKTRLDYELDNIRTAIFLNPSEEAPWIYYNWLLSQLIPAFVIHTETTESGSSLIEFNMKVSDFSPLITGTENPELEGKSGKMNSNQWVLKNAKLDRIRSNLEFYAFIRL